MMQSKIFNCASFFLLAIATPAATGGGICSKPGDKNCKANYLQYGLVNCQYTESNSGTELHRSIARHVAPLVDKIHDGEFDDVEAITDQVWCAANEQPCKSIDTGENYILMDKVGYGDAKWKGYNCKGKDASKEDAATKYSQGDWDARWDTEYVYQELLKKYKKNNKSVTKEELDEAKKAFVEAKKKVPNNDKALEFRNTKAFKERYLSGGENGLQYLSIENSLDKKCAEVVYTSPEPFQVGPFDLNNPKEPPEFRVAYVFRIDNEKCKGLVPGTTATYSYEIRLAYHRDGMTHEHIVVAIPKDVQDCEKPNSKIKCEDLRVVRRFLDQEFYAPDPTPDWIENKPAKSREVLEKKSCDVKAKKGCLPSAHTFRAATADSIQGRYGKPMPIKEIK